MSDTGYMISCVAVAAVVTVFLRAVPFLLFGGGRPLPGVVRYISRMLPPGIIAMLVVYCFGCYCRDRIPMEHYYNLAEFLSGGLVVALQLWRRNPLYSIFAGTALYMMLIQYVKL